MTAVHLVADIHFARQGEDVSWVVCTCGARMTGASHQAIADPSLTIARTSAAESQSPSAPGRHQL